MIVFLIENCEILNHLVNVVQKCMMPYAGGMKSPVLRHRTLVPYVPLRLNQVRTSCNGIHAFAHIVKKITRYTIIYSSNNKRSGVCA